MANRCKDVELKEDSNYSNPPGSTNKAKGHLTRWPFALLWFRGGREAPFGVQPELAQQAETTPKGRPLVENER